MNSQTITRKGNFDSMHRVVDHGSKCRNVHGHTYLYELTFSFSSVQKIGYNIDFADIKKIAGGWIDDFFDHGAILNPADEELIKVSQLLDSKLWVMSLNHGDYCNPTVENIAKEVLICMKLLFKDHKGLNPSHIRIYETPNCYTDCYKENISPSEFDNVRSAIESKLKNWKP